MNVECGARKIVLTRQSKFVAVLCLACQPWMSSHDVRLARREIVHYKHPPRYMPKHVSSNTDVHQTATNKNRAQWCRKFT
jgi:hypothetical protein